MPQVNTSNIQARYNEQLARLYYTVEYSPDDVLAYVLSGIDLSDINIIVAADVNSLPNLQYSTPNQPDAMVYFVQSLGIIVISSNGKWLTLDGVTIRTDTVFGLVWGWGSGRAIGDNTTTVDKSSPVSVVGGFTDWCQVTAGVYNSLAVRTNGTAWAWGNNCRGKLGDNTTVSKSSPVSVVGGFTDWCQVSAGSCHSLAVRTNGTAWGWGDNCRGQLGNNTGGAAVTTSSPVSVVGGFTDWCQVSGGLCHSLGVRTNGTAWAWGDNNCGQLGDNSSLPKSSPVSVVGGFTDWCQISAGPCHSMAVRQNGTAWGWGDGGQGRLGDNTTTNKSSPVSVVGGFTDWCQVSTGGFSTTGFSLGVRTNGSAWGWGDAESGNLGNNSITDRSSPVSVIGGFTDWCQISGTAPGNGGTGSRAVRTNGTAWAWGVNGFGQLGDNTTVDKSSPVSVVGGFTDWCQVSAGLQHSLGITTS